MAKAGLCRAYFLHFGAVRTLRSILKVWAHFKVSPLFTRMTVAEARMAARRIKCCRFKSLTAMTNSRSCDALTGLFAALALVGSEPI